MSKKVFSLGQSSTLFKIKTEIEVFNHKKSYRPCGSTNSPQKNRRGLDRQKDLG